MYIRGNYRRLLDNSQELTRSIIVKDLFVRGKKSYLCGNVSIPKLPIITDMAVRLACGISLFGTTKHDVGRPLKVLTIIDKSFEASFIESLLLTVDHLAPDDELLSENFMFDFSDDTLTELIDLWDFVEHDIVFVYTNRIILCDKLATALNCHVVCVYDLSDVGAEKDSSLINVFETSASNGIRVVTKTTTIDGKLFGDNHIRWV